MVQQRDLEAAHNILRRYMLQGLQGQNVNPTAIEGHIGNLNPRDAIVLARQVRNGQHPPALQHASARLFADEDYRNAMEKERLGQAGGFGNNRRDWADVPVEQAQAMAQGQVGAANANALGQIFGGNPGAFTQAFRRPTGWDYLSDPSGNFAGAWMRENFMHAPQNILDNVLRNQAYDRYSNRNQRNWSKVQQANDDFRHRYLDIMDKVYSGRNQTMKDLVAGMPNIVGSLGDSLKGLNMYNPAGPQGVEDVDGTALVSQAVDPDLVDVQTEIDVETQTPLQAALAGKLQTDASSELFGDEEQAAQQYAQGLGDRVSGIGSGLKGDAEQRGMSAVNVAAANTRQTQANINKMRNAADRATMTANFGGGLLQDIGGVFG